MNIRFIKILICISAMSFINLNMHAMVPLQYMQVPELTIENIDRFPKYKDYFIQYAAKNFATIDPQIIAYLINHFAYFPVYPVVDSFLKNFSIYSDKNQEPDKRDMYLKIFKAILIKTRLMSQVCQKIAEEIVKNSRTIDEAFLHVFIDYATNRLWNIMMLEDDVVNNLPTVDSVLIKNLASIIKKQYFGNKWALDSWVLRLIHAALKHDKPIDLSILLAIEEQVDNNVYRSEKERNLLENFIQKIIASLPQEYESLDLDALVFLYNYNKEGAPEKKILREHICSRMKSLKRPESIEKFIQSSKNYKTGFRLCYPENPSQTQTRPHFIQYIDEIAFYLKDLPQDIKSLALTIYKKEREERKKGLYVFIMPKTGIELWALISINNYGISLIRKIQREKILLFSGSHDRLKQQTKEKIIYL